MKSHQREGKTHRKQYERTSVYRHFSPTLLNSWYCSGAFCVSQIRNLIKTNFLTLRVAAVFLPRNPCDSHRHTFETGSSDNRPGCWFLVLEGWV